MKRLALTITSLALVSLAGCSIPGDSTTYADRVVAEQSPPTTTRSTTEETAPKLTTAQENAIEKANSYLDFSAFSRKGLIEQLEFEGYSTEDATFAVTHIDVNWNNQAVAKAESYLDSGSFSRQGLIDQLRFEGFTAKQAEYGVSRAYES